MLKHLKRGSAIVLSLCMSIQLGLGNSYYYINANDTVDPNQQQEVQPTDPNANTDASTIVAGEEGTSTTTDGTGETNQNTETPSGPTETPTNGTTPSTDTQLEPVKEAASTLKVEYVDEAGNLLKTEDKALAGKYVQDKVTFNELQLTKDIEGYTLTKIEDKDDATIQYALDAQEITLSRANTQLKLSYVKNPVNEEGSTGSNTGQGQEESQPSEEEQPSDDEEADSSKPTEEDSKADEETKDDGKNDVEEKTYSILLGHYLSTNVGNFEELETITLKDSDFENGKYDLSKNQYIREGMELISSVIIEQDNVEEMYSLNYRVKDGYIARRKTANISLFRAVYVGTFDGVEIVPAGQIPVEITYVYEDGTVAKTSETIMAEENLSGEYDFSHTVDVPAGFTMKIESADPENGYTVNENTITATFDKDAKSGSLVLTFVANEQEYTVEEHYPQLNDQPDVVEKRKENGKVGELTDVTATDKEGFTAKPITQQEIKADGSTKVTVEYERNEYKVTYDTQGGSYIKAKKGLYEESVDVYEETVGNPKLTCGMEEHTHTYDSTDRWGNKYGGCYSSRYGDYLTCRTVEHTHEESCYTSGTTWDPTPTRQGYTFGGWYKDAECTGKADTIVTLKEDVTVYAKWIPSKANYTIAYFKQVWDNNAKEPYYVYDSSEIVSGTVGETVKGGDSKEIDYCQYSSSDSAVVKADGSTVVNVYYNLREYKLTFNLNNSNAKITINGKEYTGSNYSFTAHIGEDVSDRWPTAEHISGNRNQFYAWNHPNGTPYASKRFELTADMITNVNTIYKASYINDLSKRVLHYMLENADGNGYTDEPKYQQIAYTTADNDYSAKDIFGFTNVKKEYEYIDNVKHQYFYYNRTKHSITYKYNDEELKTESDIRFGADISSEIYNFVPDRPAGLDSEYEFKGWYDNAECLGDPYAFTTMPGNDVALYAKWEAPEKYVTLVYNNGEENGKITVKKGEFAEILTPEREGYVFEGWYTDTEFNNEFDVNAPITEDVTIYAKWSQNKYTTYTVRYVVEENGEYKDIADLKENIPGLVGATVHEKAKAFTEGDYKGYAVDASSKTLTLDSVASNNVILFIYTSPKALTYTVQYVYGDTVVEEETNLSAQAAKFKVTPNQDIANDLKTIGYSISEPFVMANLVSDNSKNIIKFNLIHASYTITYEGLEGITGWDKDGYIGTENPNKTKYTIVTPTFTLVNPVKEGYEFTGWTTGAKVESGIHDGKQVSIEQGSRGNLTFTATWKQYVTINYVAGTGGSVSLDSETLAPVTGIAQGSTATAATGYTFVGWFENEDGEGTNLGTVANFIPTKEETGLWTEKTYYAIFKANTDTAYTINHYKVSADGEKATLEKSENLAATTDTTVTAEAMDIPGYTYQKDYNQNGMITIASGTVKGDGSLVLNLYYTPNTNTAYTVEYYYQKEGKYEEAPTTVTRKGTTDTKAEVTAEDKTPKETGFVLDKDAVNVFEGNIAGDGTTVLKVYFKQQFTVTYEPGDHGSFETQTTGSLDYNDETPVAPETVGKPGYTFNGWSPEVAETVTGNATYTAQWIIDENSRVNVTYLAENGGSVTPTENSIQIVTADGLTSSTATPNPGYEFVAWYKGNEKISDSAVLDTDTVKANLNKAQNGTYTETSFVAKFKLAEYKLTINYVDEQGNKLADSHEATHEYGASYSVKSPIITGYKLKNIQQYIVSGTMDASDIIINVVYVQNKYTVIINHIDEDTNEVLKAEAKFDVVHGTEITGTADQEIIDSGYVMTSAETAVVEKENTVIKVYYSVDEKGGEGENPDETPDGIADKYQVRVSYEVINGTFTKEVKPFYLTKTKDGKNDVNGSATLPEDKVAETAPNTGYGSLTWKPVTPVKGMEIKTDINFVGTYSINKYDAKVQYIDEDTKKPILEDKELTNVEYGTVIDGSEHKEDIEGYAYISAETKTVEGEGTVVNVYYSVDTKGGEGENPDETPDGIADKYQVRVSYEVINGTFTKEVKPFYLTKVNDNGDYAEDGIAYLPAEKVAEVQANEGYQAIPVWRDNIPAANTRITEDTVFSAEFMIDQFNWTVNFHYIDENGEEVLEPMTVQTGRNDFGSKILDVATVTIPDSISDDDSNNYTKLRIDGEDQKVTTDATKNVVDVYYAKDNHGTNPENPDKGDEIPDMYQVKVNFAAVNGTVNFAYTYVTLVDENGKPSENGTGTLTEKQKPTAKANEGYTNGKWDKELTSAISKETTFTITFETRKDLDYEVHYFYDGTEEKDQMVIEENAEFGTPIPYKADKTTTYNKKNYVLEKVEKTGDGTVTVNRESNIINVYYLVDEKGTDPENPDKGDEIPDIYQVTVNYITGGNGTVTGTTEEVLTIKSFTRDENGNISNVVDIVANPKADVTANADTGYALVNWTSGETAYANVEAIRTINVREDMTFTANFGIDANQTKDLSATVDYVLDGVVQDHVDLKTTVQVLQPDTLSTDGVETKSYEGYILESITVDGNVVNALPATVNNGSKVVYNYTLDVHGTNPENPDKGDNIPDKYQVKVNFAAVNGTVSFAYTYVTLEKEGKPAADGEGYLAEEQIPTTNANTGYFHGTWDKELTMAIREETTFTITYVRDDSQTASYSYKVNHIVEGTLRETDTVTKTFWINDVVTELSVDDINYRTYEGYAVDSIATGAIPEVIAVNGEINIYYAADTHGTDPENPDKGDNIPDKYQARVDFTVENGTLSFDHTYVTLVDANGNYSETGTGTLAETQIPTATAAAGYDQASLHWTNGTPVDGMTISGNTTFNVAFNANPVTPVEPTTPPTTPTEPESRVTPTPVVETPEVEEVEENETPRAGDTEEVEDSKTPKANLAYWALINLICAVLTVLLAILLLISRRHKNNDDEEEDEAGATVAAVNEEDDEEDEEAKKRGWMTRVFAVIIAILSVIMFILTEDMRNPMVLVDKWTIWMVIIGIVQIVVFLIGRKWKTDEEEDEEAEQQA